MAASGERTQVMGEVMVLMLEERLSEPPLYGNGWGGCAPLGFLPTSIAIGYPLQPPGVSNGNGHLYDLDSTTTTQKQGEKVDSRVPSARHLHYCTQFQAQRSPLSQQEYVQSQAPIILTHEERDHATQNQTVLASLSVPAQNFEWETPGPGGDPSIRDEDFRSDLGEDWEEKRDRMNSSEYDSDPEKMRLQHSDSEDEDESKVQYALDKRAEEGRVVGPFRLTPMRGGLDLPNRFASITCSGCNRKTNTRLWVQVDTLGQDSTSQHEIFQPFGQNPSIRSLQGE
ncbi:hypothetical protein RSAG8_13534, partial [Rhizoctonia solani AG-8 WAC10335]